MPPLLGCIADDFTGATDLAGMLVRAGMRTVQTIGVPPAAPENVDAIVVALKTRTIPAAEAVDQSLAALVWLREAGCRRFYFKYCSTFDSTDAGNIGPVADALLGALGPNGGPTWTVPPSAASPAVDGVPAGQCYDDEGRTLDHDQRGLPRPVGASCDVGAVERQ